MMDGRHGANTGHGDGPRTFMRRSDTDTAVFVCGQPPTLRFDIARIVLQLDECPLLVPVVFKINAQINIFLGLKPNASVAGNVELPKAWIV